MKINSNYIPLSERIAKLHFEPHGIENSGKKTFDSEKTTGNVSIRSDLSKAGLANVFMGQKQSGLNKNPSITNNLLENNMIGKLILPIKAMIIEEGLTDFFQNNASKLSTGIKVGVGAGLGAAALHAANGGDFNLEQGNHPPSNLPGSSKWDNMSDYEKDVAKNSISTDVHDATKPRGYLGNMTHALGTGLDNIRAEHKIQDMKDDYDKYIATRDSEGRLLPGIGTTLGLGAAGLGTAAILAKAKRRR